MMTDHAPSIVGRSKITPAWVTEIKPTCWMQEPGWVCEGAVRLPIEPSAKSNLEIALIQRDGNWLAIAACQGSWFRFDLLSFIALWNESAAAPPPEALQDIYIHLFADVTEPNVLRHPSVIPMEVSFDHQTDRFRRSMIYSIFDAPEDPD